MRFSARLRAATVAPALLMASIVLSSAASPARALAPATASSSPPVITHIDRSAGPMSGGVVVNITGTGLLGAAGVSFGSVAASQVRVNSDTAITVTSPAQPGSHPDDITVDITVSRSGTSSALTDVDRFTYTIGRWSPAGSMPAPVQQPLTAVLDPPVCHQGSPPAGYPCGSVLVAGGTGRDASCCSAAYLFDPSGATWTPTGTMSSVRHSVTLTLLADGSVLAAGGTGSQGNVLASAELYQPAAGTWSPAPPLSAPRSDATATVLSADGSVLVAGGHDANGQVLASAEIFHPAAVGQAAQWTAAASMTSVRWLHAAVALPGGSVLVAGGINGNLAPLASAELYTPSADRWSVIASMSTARSRASATLLADQTVMVVGGTDRSGSLASAEIYSDATRGWTATPPMGVARGRPAAITISGGRVLVTGQEGAGATELYTPSAGAWSPTAAMATARSGFGAVPLGGASVVVVGGLQAGGSSSYVLASAEVWDPTPATVVLPPPAVTAVSPPEGGPSFGGTAVTITGTDLFPATSVRFGTVEAAAITVNSDTTIVASSPPHDPGTVDIVVVTPSAGSPSAQSKADLFRYFAPPQPTITGISPASGPTFGGTSVTITGTGFYFPPSQPATGDAVRFGDAAAVSVSVSSPTTLIAASPVHQQVGSVDVTVTTPGGTSTAGAPSQAFTYVTAESPAITKLTPNHGPSSGGTSVVITGSGLYLPPGVTVADAVRFGSSPAQSGSVDSATQITAVAPPLPPGTAAAVTVTNPAGTSSGSVRFYYETQGAWTPSASLADGRYGHTATLLDPGQCHRSDPAGSAYPCGSVLVAGGVNGFLSASSNDLRTRDGAELYTPSPSGGSWRSAGAGNTGSMSVCAPPSASCAARTFHTATLLDGPACRTSSPPAYCGRVLVTGGQVVMDTQLHYVSSAELYDPLSGWRAAPSLSVPRTRHTATLLDPQGCRDGTAPPAYPCGQVLVTGGADDGSAELYNPAAGDTGAWTSCPAGPATPGCPGSMSARRMLHTATLLRDGGVLVAGGVDTLAGGTSTNLLSAEVYSPATGLWTPTGSMAQPRLSHSATLLDGPSCNSGDPPAFCGDVLVAGGVADADSNGGYALFRNTSELYVPGYVSPQTHVKGGWMAAGQLTMARAGHSATLLANGQVLVSGGGMSFELHFKPYIIVGPPTAELYDPRRAAWIVTENMGTPRGLHTSTLLDGPACRGPGVSPAYCGAVLAAGGSGGGPAGCANPWSGFTGDCPQDLASAELYTHAPTMIGLSPASGSNAGGQRVTISGTGFGPGDAVTFDDVPAAAMSIDSPTQITVVAPRHPQPGVVTVAVTNAVGSSVLSPPDPAALFTYENCAPTAAAGQLLYPSGYSLIGLPEGTSVPAQSLLYSWFDQGPGSYGAESPTTARTVAGHGYWAWFSCPREVTPAGSGVPDMTVTLGAGHASMVGNPSATGRVSVSGQDFGARWDPALNSGTGGYDIAGYRQPQDLAVGEGMWVFSYAGAAVGIHP